MTYEIKDHWIEGIPHRKTKKYSTNRVLTPKAIVYHFTCGWTTEGDVHQLSEASAKVSAHLVAGRDGELVQIVPFNRPAWHAGPSRYGSLTSLNFETIGIEISNIGWLRKLPSGLYEDYHGNRINRSGAFVNSKRKTKSPPKDWLLTERHPVVGTGPFVWEPYYTAQLATLEQATLALVKQYPTIKLGLTHEEIDTRKWKSDPGPAFPIDHFRKLITNPNTRPLAEADAQEEAPKKVGWTNKVSNWLRWPMR